LQKLFAFCKNDNDGLFRIDVERIGKTIYLNRVEASDLMQIDYETYDQHLKQKCCRAAGPLTSGPHFQVRRYHQPTPLSWICVQVVTYQFGNFKCLVRHEVDCCEYDVKFGPAPELNGEHTRIRHVCECHLRHAGTGGERQHFDKNPDLEFVHYGEMRKTTKLMSLTTYPHGSGFPFFTWAQLFFTGALHTCRRHE
jgi:hypothetical protein